MSFFPLYSSDRSLTPLFRLLDDFDSYSRESQGTHGHRRQPVRTFNPKFDVRETESAYELHGELPGVDRDNIQIEFTEPQTLVVRGRVERTYTAGTPPTGQVEEGAEPKGAISEDGESDTASAVSHKATVEDDVDESLGEQFTPVETPVAQVADQAEKPQKPQKPQAQAAKYWVSERSIGDFSRSFNFPARVDQDAVTANLNNGILTVAIPKAKKHESRRITVS